MLLHSTSLNNYGGQGSCSKHFEGFLVVLNDVKKSHGTSSPQDNSFLIYSKFCRSKDTLIQNLASSVIDLL